MAHLVDGVLSVPVLIGGVVLTAAGLSIGLRRVAGDRLPYCGLMSAVFFVASLVHVPIGPSNVHLIMNGLLGIVLGWAAVPAVFVGLLLQAVFFGYGGITALGVNTVIMALPAVVCCWLFSSGLRRGVVAAGVWAAVAGAGAVALTCALAGLMLALSGREFVPAAKLVLVAHLPVAAVEAVLSALVVVFLRRVKPEVLALSVNLPSVQASRA